MTALSSGHATAPATRRPFTERFAWRVLAVLVALALGAMAAIAPMATLIGVGALAAAGFCLPRGNIAVAAFAGTAYFEMVGANGMTPVKLMGGVVALNAVLLLLTARGRRTVAAPAWQLHPFVLVLSLALVAWAFSSVVWATDLAQVQQNGSKLLTNVLVFLAIPLLIRTTRDLRVLGWWIVGASLAGALGGVVLGNQVMGRATGMFSDPNEFATSTVIGAAFAMALGETSGQATARWLGRLAASASVVAVVMSGSRTGLIACAVALLVLVVTARGLERIRLAGVLSVGIAVAAAWLALSPATGAVGTRLSAEDTSGRIDLWRVARNMFVDEPVHGVGLGNYPAVSIAYMGTDVRNRDLFTRLPRTVHNLPLELLAELGIVGFLLFSSLAGSAMVIMTRSLRRARGLGDPMLVGALRGGLASMIALLVASLALSGLYIELLWVMFGASIAASSIVRSRMRLRADEADAAILADAALLEAAPDAIELSPVRASLSA